MQTQTPGIELKHGLSFNQVKGEVKLRHDAGGVISIVEHGIFYNTAERHYLMRIWSRKHIVHTLPHHYTWIINLNEPE